MKELEIVFKNKEFVVINKPPLVPSQPDPSGDEDAMTKTAEMLKEMGERDKLWLVHRLDRVVGGLLVFARNQKVAAELSALAASGGIEKHYLAVCLGDAPGGEMRDFLYKDSLTKKAYVCQSARKGAKEAVLEYRKLSSQNGMTLVEIDLKTGRFHQIRAQFSSRKLPLAGDKKYGSRDGKSKVPALFAFKLGFELFGKKYSFSAMPDCKKYPWSLFAEDGLEKLL